MAVTITSAALRYQGSGYVYGGPGWPPGNWDCSSFVSEVIGRQLGLGLPGGGRWGSPGYPPNAHGPDVDAYDTWGGSVPVAAGTPGALVLWAGAGPNGHIGICLGPDKMISALNPNYGTAVTPINGYGPGGLSPVYRAVTGAAGGPGAPSGAPGTDVASMWDNLFPSLSWKDVALPALAVAAVLAAGIIATGVLFAAGTAGAVWLARRGMS